MTSATLSLATTCTCPLAPTCLKCAHALVCMFRNIIAGRYVCMPTCSDMLEMCPCACLHVWLWPTLLALRLASSG